MPRPSRIIINTSPLIALIAAWGNLDPMDLLYDEVIVPWEVSQEVKKGGSNNFAVSEFQSAKNLLRERTPVSISQFLLHSLDLGEASVIQLALDRGVELVCIDEAVGRRIARLNGLKLTGSVGILLRWKQINPTFSLQGAIDRMLARKIRLSEGLIKAILRQADDLNFQ